MVMTVERSIDGCSFYLLFRVEHNSLRVGDPHDVMVVVIVLYGQPHSGRQVQVEHGQLSDQA